MMAKDKEYNTLIHTQRWRNLRYAVLSEHPLCERCQQQGRITAACEVHHRLPVEEAYSHADRVRRMYDRSNLMAVCHNCHVQIHTEMGRSGKDANVKRVKKQAEELIHKFFGE